MDVELSHGAPIMWTWSSEINRESVWTKNVQVDRKKN